MSTIHIFLQGKGGVGKSLSACLFMQYLLQHLPHDAVSGVDLDPVNNSLAGYKSLPVKAYNIMEGAAVNQRSFDDLIEELLVMPQGSHAIIDCGASTFLPLGSYLAENESLSLLRESGHEVYIHTVVTGGQAMADTLNGLKTLATNKGYQGTQIVVWENSYFGPLLYDGLSLEDSSAWKHAEGAGQIHSLIKIPNLNAATYGTDLRDLFMRRKTFAEAAEDSAMYITVRSRLAIFFRKMCEELDRTRLVDATA